MDVGEEEPVLGGLGPISLPTQEVPSFMTQRGTTAALLSADEIRAAALLAPLIPGCTQGRLRESGNLAETDWQL